MARDIRTSIKGCGSRCKWYKAKYVSNNRLLPDAICQGVFYAKDKVAESHRREITAGYASTIGSFLTIETNDYLDGLEVNDYIKINGILWRVESLPRIDDTEEQKFYTRRPTTTWNIDLRR